MIVRSITSEELSEFANICDEDGEFRKFIEKTWSDGESKPELCFVLEYENKFLGRVAYCQYSSMPEEYYLFGVHLDWNDEFLDPGLLLLKKSIDNLRDARFVFANLNSNSKFINEKKELFEESGFVKCQNKWDFIYDKTLDFKAEDEKLTYKNLLDVGEGSFVDAIERVTEETLDNYDLDSIKAYGSRQAAQNYFDVLKSIEYKPERWFLAYLPERGELAGLVVVQEYTKNRGMINYIGVVPEHRGNHYIDVLLMKGVKELYKLGYISVLGEIDTENKPLAAALIRCGFKKGKTTWWYRL